MRFMILRHADAVTERGEMPSPELMTAMGSYMESMVKAGILKGGDGLKPSREGVRMTLSKGSPKPRIVDGPFTESKELVAGYAIIEVGAREEAIEWLKKWPREDIMDESVTIELRPFYEVEDFGEALTDEEHARQERMRAQIEKQK